ncbi:unnamed protein product [Leptidea sinapis]|uniref:Uncharacterized protein n=1 Tax=Leptidea sinapis TaxID=189913 RepID=A0A5E4PWZ8_9NEOP|nr:unnamed protein product [Leptidea sinapis]
MPGFSQRLATLATKGCARAGDALSKTQSPRATRSPLAWLIRDQHRAVMSCRESFCEQSPSHCQPLLQRGGGRGLMSGGASGATILRGRLAPLRRRFVLRFTVASNDEHASSITKDASSVFSTVFLDTMALSFHQMTTNRLVRKEVVIWPEHHHHHHFVGSRVVEVLIVKAPCHHQQGIFSPLLSLVVPVLVQWVVVVGHIYPRSLSLGMVVLELQPSLVGHQPIASCPVHRIAHVSAMLLPYPAVYKGVVHQTLSVVPEALSLTADPRSVNLKLANVVISELK